MLAAHRHCAMLQLNTSGTHAKAMQVRSSYISTFGGSAIAKVLGPEIVKDPRYLKVCAEYSCFRISN